MALSKSQTWTRPFFLLMLYMGWNRVIQVIVIVIKYFHKANAHTKSSIILIDTIEVWPDHFARNIYDLVIGRNDTYAIIFIKA